MLGAAVDLAPGTFLAIVAAAALAGTLAALAGGRGLVLPVVVLELLLGIVLGPWVLGLHVSELVGFFSDLGLGLLFFFAGYEIDLRRIAGRPLKLALLGWALSLALAYAIGGILAAAGIVLSLLYTGSALATTAIGTLIPVLSDTGDLRTRFGSFLLAAGAVGEFGPILLITLILSSEEHRAQRADPDRVHRPRGRRGGARRALLRADYAAARAHPREQLATGLSGGSSCSCSRSRCSPSNSGSTCSWEASRRG